MTVFAGVIAITKDMPDIAGDKKFNINTWAVRAGSEKVANVGCAVLGVNYASAVVEAVTCPGFNRGVMVGGHCLFGAYLLRARAMFVAGQKESSKSFYAKIWKLFYMEYLLYPFI
mmetsp:Transcript_12946/g.19356  ORF Transcript_12946/g.19356 Transcript_12946/m.19356 type:complete len:115 (-) Transcript_12946:41-385(-)